VTAPEEKTGTANAVSILACSNATERSASMMTFLFALQTGFPDPYALPTAPDQIFTPTSAESLAK